jgi:hypothetical protein
MLVCNDCSKELNISLELYNCYIGLHECEICKEKIDTTTQTYHCFRQQDVIAAMFNKLTNKEKKDG